MGTFNITKVSSTCPILGPAEPPLVLSPTVNYYYNINEEEIIKSI